MLSAPKFFSVTPDPARRSAFVNEWRCWRMEAEKNGGKVIAGAPFTFLGARLRSLLLSHVSAYGVI